MTDMRVKMILDLVANTKGGAAQAKRELKGVKDAARDLNRQEAGKRIARDILSISSNSKGAARGLREVKGAATGVGQDGATARLARDLEKARAAAARLKAELAGVKKQNLKAHLANAPGAGRGTDAKGATTLFPGTRGMLGGYLGIQAARAGIRGTVGQSVSFEKAMADVIKKVDLPEGQSPLDLEKMITGSAIQFGRSREQIAGLAAELGAAGVAYTDLGRAIAQATRASVAWDMTPSETGESLAKIRTQHGMSLDQLDEFIDKVNALADTGAAKERDIVEMFQRAAAGAKVADVDRDPSLAFLTAMNAGGMQPEIAARGFGAMVSKLRTAKSNGNKNMAEGLKMLGLTPAQVEKGMQTDSLKTLTALMDRFAQSSNKAAIAVKMFGEGWWDEFSRMVQGAPEIAKNLRLLQNPAQWQGSSQKSLNVELRTTANHLERLKALASDIGDRFGRWALPPINSVIERLIEALAALDRQTADKKSAEQTGQKLADGVPLTPEERRRLLDDKVFADRASATARDAQEARKDRAEAELRAALERDHSDDGMNQVQGARLRELARRKLDREIEELSSWLQQRDPSGADSMLVGQRRKLASLRGKRAELGEAEAPSTAKLIERSDADEMRARVPRSTVMRLRDQLARAEERLAALEALKGKARTEADRQGFDADAAPWRRAKADAEARLRLALAPQLSAASRFRVRAGGVQGKGWGDSRDANWAPGTDIPAVGSGLTSFGLGGGVKGAGRVGKGGWGNSGAAWAERVRSEFDIDFGEAGVTLMDRVRANISSGGSAVVAAASAVKDNVLAALAGGDATGAGQAAMSTYAAGIRAGGDAAVAAARDVAGRVQGALASGSGGRRGLQGALHDGVD